MKRRGRAGATPVRLLTPRACAGVDAPHRHEWTYGRPFMAMYSVNSTLAAFGTQARCRA
ncbi:Hypothetical protein I596_1777 [Dokdonella koreensis DS-123]|uniref:Uncharacterized protein n=1 Tax=Dokdonella koreensis DS-123 TaxID=1300342 RepID=A0A160DUS8_9GAMM|nr:Hypothetical protein I596_1777 [Dokdonella koreensis DS-123]